MTQQRVTIAELAEKIQYEGDVQAVRYTTGLSWEKAEQHIKANPLTKDIEYQSRRKIAVNGLVEAIRETAEVVALRDALTDCLALLDRQRAEYNSGLAIISPGGPVGSGPIATKARAALAMVTP